MSHNIPLITKDIKNIINRLESEINKCDEYGLPKEHLISDLVSMRRAVELMGFLESLPLRVQTLNWD